MLHFSVTLNTVKRKLMDLIWKYQMSRTVAFGRDVLNAPDVDIEDLLACLSPSEVQVFLFIRELLFIGGFKKNSWLISFNELVIKK